MLEEWEGEHRCAHAAMLVIVAERLHLAVRIPEAHRVRAQEPQAYRLAPAHNADRQGRVPVLLQALGRNQAAAVVRMMWLDERRGWPPSYPLA